jgi:Tfp pilus assembly protein PilF
MGTGQAVPFLDTWGGENVKCVTLVTMSVCCFVVFGSRSFGQDAKAKNELAERARHEFLDRNYAEAERDFRELTRADPSNILAHMFLGQSLFSQEKYAEAVGPYERVRELEAKRKVFSVDQKRVLTDQLSMSYGMSGQIEKARALLEAAVRQDPEYPLNYYNLACAFAEAGDRDQMLANLVLAFQHKKNMLKGEQLPDPRSDPSFQKYIQDPEFIKLAKGAGLK